MTTVSTRADALLSKRCALLESKLQWPSNIPATPPPGMKYLHFRANGLTTVCTRNYELGRSAETLDGDPDNIAQRAAHHSDLWAGALEASIDLQNISWEDLNAYGLNPLSHPAHLPVGVGLRQPWTNLMTSMYGNWPGFYNSPTGNVRQLYKPFELVPDDPSAGWTFQKLSLLGKAASHKIATELSQRHAEGAEAYTWSAREAGFPDANFAVDATVEPPTYQSYIPENAVNRGHTSDKNSFNHYAIHHHNPTILLMTLAVPEDIETWLADAANAGSVVPFTAYCRWVACPHWMGFGVSVGSTFFGRSSVDAFPYNAANVGEMALSNSCHYIYGDTAGDRDLVIYTPADANNGIYTPAI